MARTRKNGIWVGTESSYSTAPAGSAMLNVPALSVGPLLDALELLETNYATARNWRTPHEAGRDGWSFDMSVPVSGLSTSGANAQAPVADDWLDLLLTHIFGVQRLITGSTFSTASTTSISGFTSAGGGITRGPGDLYPFFDPNITVPLGLRTQWAMLCAASGTLSPVLPVAPTVATGVCRASKNYRFSDTGGASLAFAYRQDDVDYTLTGGRCTKAVLVAEMGQIALLNLSFAGDTKTQATPSSLPAIAPFSRNCKAMLSPVWFGTGAALTNYETRRIEVDFGLQTAERESTAAANGRADYELIEARPTIMIEPLFADAIVAMKRAATASRILAQFGAGVLSGSVLNTCAVIAEAAVLSEVNPKDDKGRIRHGCKFEVTDPVYFNSPVTPSTSAIPIQFSRA